MPELFTLDKGEAVALTKSIVGNDSSFSLVKPAINSFKCDSKVITSTAEEAASDFHIQLSCSNNLKNTTIGLCLKAGTGKLAL